MVSLLAGCAASDRDAVVEAGPAQADTADQAATSQNVGGANSTSEPDDGGATGIDEAALDSALRVLLATELALLGDSGVVTAHTEAHNQALMERVVACLDEAGIAQEAQQDLLPPTYVTGEPVEGNPISREHVERYAFGLTRSPQSESPPIEIVDEGPSQGEIPPETDHEAQQVLAECENAALGQVAEASEALNSSPLVSRLSTQVALTLEPFFQAKQREWQACMAERGYGVADVDELIGGLELENRSRSDAWQVERDAALADHDCHGGEQGLRAILQERVDAMDAAVRELSPAEQAELVELLVPS